jgi:GxxExxY protein
MISSQTKTTHNINLAQTLPLRLNVGSLLLKPKPMLTQSSLNHLEYKIIGACIEVHKALGPGLLESIYHKCLCREFFLQGISFSSEHSLLINYKGEELDTELKADFLVENSIALEIKAVEGLLPVHEAQALSYMKLTSKAKGILVNFNCTNIFQHGKKSFVNDLYRGLPE